MLHHYWSTEVGKLRVSGRSGSPIVRKLADCILLRASSGKLEQQVLLGHRGRFRFLPSLAWISGATASLRSDACH
jgi:hypothetical protein